MPTHEERVFQIVSNVMNYPLEKVNSDSSQDSIEVWDSLNQINLVLALEEEFGINFTDDQIIEMLDVRTIIEILKGAAQ